MGNPCISSINSNFYSPVLINDSIEIPSVKNTVVLKKDYNNLFTSKSYGFRNAHISMTDPNGKTEILSDTENESGGIHKLDLFGTYSIKYYGTTALSETFWGSAHVGTSFYNFSYTFYITIVESFILAKNYTITSVINRCLELAEPLRKGEKPRFRLNGMRVDGTIITDDNKKQGEEVGQAVRFDKILCPQLSFTKLNLREQLQEIGKIIHAEPRAMPKKDADGWYYEISYDAFANSHMSDISKHKPVIIETAHAVESFCSALDSSTENLINTLDKYGGTVTEPFENGSQTVRTENAYVRVTDNDMLISTRYPIYSIKKLEYLGIYEEDQEENNKKVVDITRYIYESSEYNRLSSYLKSNNSKIYALRYDYLGRNISGLNFKIERAGSNATAKGNYSIVEIIRKASGDSAFTVGDTEFPEMQFRVTYTPIYNTRISQTKVYYKDVRYAADLFFNQQANLVETKYYGENLKGIVARLGNIEKSITYYLQNIYSIPQAGDKFDEDYIISAVAVEYLPTIIKCTVALTKSFNRISQYIGISSEKRFSEISETQAVERNCLYREYIVIGDAEPLDRDTRIGNNFLAAIRDSFTQLGDYEPVSSVVAWGESYKGNKTNPVILPVISSAFGNSISFSWEYADNYSAGNIVNFYTEGTGDEKIEGYFQNTYRYTDTFGRIFYYHFDLMTGSIAYDAMKLPSIPEDAVPTVSSGYFSTIGQQPYILRKDNRETMQFNVQIDFVTNLPDMIIGSALASYCPAVRGTDKRLKAKLYVFKDPLDKFIDHVEGSVNVKLDELPSIDITFEQGAVAMYLTTESGAFPSSGKAWAIVTNQYFGEVQKVEDEKGEVDEYQEINGGDVLLAQNIDFAAGDVFKPIYFTPKREVFDKSVWVDKR